LQLFPFHENDFEPDFMIFTVFKLSLAFIFNNNLFNLYNNYKHMGCSAPNKQQFFLPKFIK